MSNDFFYSVFFFYEVYVECNQEGRQPGNKHRTFSENCHCKGSVISLCCLRCITFFWDTNPTENKLFNPLLPIAHKSTRIGKISILKLEGIIKKNSYERRDYESVDEKSLS